MQDLILKNISKFYAYDFLAMLLKHFWLTFRKICKALASLGSCHVTSFQQGLNKNLQFLRFLQHISNSFQYFSWKLWYKDLINFLQQRSKVCLSTLASLEAWLKAPILAIFWQVLAIFKLFVLAQVLNLGQWSTLETFCLLCTFTCHKSFFHYSDHLAKNQGKRVRVWGHFCFEG